MKIVYDMRTGEVIERAEAPRRNVTEVQQIPTDAIPAVELQLAEYRWSQERYEAPPTFLACYFDEEGE